MKFKASAIAAVALFLSETVAGHEGNRTNSIAVNPITATGVKPSIQTTTVGTLATAENITTTVALLTRNSTIFTIPTCTIGHTCVSGFNFTGFPGNSSSTANTLTTSVVDTFLSEITVTSFRTLTTTVEFTTDVVSMPYSSDSTVPSAISTALTVDPFGTNTTSPSATPAMSTALTLPSTSNVTTASTHAPLRSVSVAYGLPSAHGNLSWSIGSGAVVTPSTSMSAAVQNMTISVVPLPITTTTTSANEETDTTVFETSFIFLTTTLASTTAVSTRNSDSTPTSTGEVEIEFETMNSAQISSLLARESSTSTFSGLPGTTLSVTTTPKMQRVQTTTTPTLFASTATITPFNPVHDNGAHRAQALALFFWLKEARIAMAGGHKARDTETFPLTTDSGTSSVLDATSVSQILTWTQTRTTLILLSSLPVSTTFASSVQPQFNTAILSTMPSVHLNVSSELSRSTTTSSSGTDRNTISLQDIESSLAFLLTAINLTDPWGPWSTTAELPSYGLWNTSRVTATDSVDPASITTSAPNANSTPLVQTGTSLLPVTKTIVNKNFAMRSHTLPPAVFSLSISSLKNISPDAVNGLITFVGTMTFVFIVAYHVL